MSTKNLKTKMVHALTGVEPYRDGSLAGYFGYALLSRAGAKAIADFAAEHSEFVALAPDGQKFSFGTEDTIMEVVHDLDQDLRPVFHGRIITFCPETVEFHGLFPTIERAITAIKIALVELTIERNAKPKAVARPRKAKK